MIRVLMLDLGDTLTDGTRPLPFVPESLEALSRFVTAEGQALEVCLVSDFHLANPFTEARVATLFSEYLELLDGLALRNFFEPVDKRVTLSTHANALKPDRSVFSTALTRLGSNADFDNCLFVTENPNHIAACRTLGMQTLTFGVNDPTEGFPEWPEGILLIAHLIDPRNRNNIEASLSNWASAHHQCEFVRESSFAPDGHLQGSAQCWTALQGLEPQELDRLNVLLPGQIDVRFDAHGIPLEFETKVSSPETLAEARVYVERLAVGGRIAEDPLTIDPNKTHVIETLPDGRRFLKRRGYD